MRPTQLSRPLVTLLVLGCALLALAPLGCAQRPRSNRVPRTTARFDALDRLAASLNAVPANKATVQEMNRDQAILKAMDNGSLNAVVDSKYPKVAALYQAAGLTPQDLLQTVVSVSLAENGIDTSRTDPATAKANVAFYNANKERVAKVIRAVTF